jgi:hypothetical protein
MSFDLDALLKIYNEVFSKYQRHRQTDHYGVIGFQGSTEDDHLSAAKRGTLIGIQIGDVWQTVHPNKIDGFINSQRKSLSVQHKVLCTGEFKKIVDYLEDNGWRPFRARIMEALPGVESGGWHLDGYDGSIRYHVPLITNEECYLQWRDNYDEIKSFNLPADGSGYWVNTDVVHHFINLGDTIRAHIIVDLVKK